MRITEKQKAKKLEPTRQKSFLSPVTNHILRKRDSETKVKPETRLKLSSSSDELSRSRSKSFGDVGAIPVIEEDVDVDISLIEKKLFRRSAEFKAFDRDRNPFDDDTELLGQSEEGEDDEDDEDGRDEWALPVDEDSKAFLKSLTTITKADDIFRDFGCK